ncbi:hypothetical protein [Pectobacterium cacticida]|uniref:hypothetical protein n=1 Tax=Pectobacterium cacticida TaxID=69221 RepID=UPI0039866139
MMAAEISMMRVKKHTYCVIATMKDTIYCAFRWNEQYLQDVPRSQQGCDYMRLTTRRINSMAKTKSSVKGVQNKKIVVVSGYTKVDGTKVKPHRRSTPN